MRETLNYFLKSFLILLIVTLGAGVMNADDYALLTDASTLTAGDEIIITNSSSTQALSITQNTNNRGQTSVSVIDGKITPSNSVQIIELEESETDGRWYFKVGVNAYLYAASSSNNHLKTNTKTTAGNNGKWLISISNGAASITANGSNTHNKLKYNATNNPPIFSCYASGQQGIKVYKKVSAITYKITYSNAHGVNPSQTTHHNGDVITTFPTVEPSETCADNGWGFIGWSTDENTPHIVSSVTITKDTTLYAFYKLTDISGVAIKDTITSSVTNIKVSSYFEFSNITLNSDAVYAGQCAGSNSYVQLRSNTTNSIYSGIVTTTSGGKIGKVTLVWDVSTIDGRTVDVYAKNTEYDSSYDLYDSDYYGDKVGSIVCGVSTELVIDGDYSYIGLRSNSGALYLDKIIFTWEISHETSTYSTNPKCYDAEVSIAHWSKDSINFNIGEIGTTTNVILLSSGDTIKSYTHSSDNSYRFDRARLDTIPCTDMKFITAKADGAECIRKYQVPIMVYGAGKTVDDVMTMNGCDNCDLVILPNSKLTINKDTASRNVTIYETAVLSIPYGKTYTVNSLTLRRDNDSVPHLSYKGTLDIKNGMFFELRTDADDWRWITLPDTFSASDIRIEPEILLGYYDGEYRAQHGRGAWKNPADDREFMPGEGFIYGINIDGTEKRIYRYEIDTAVLKTEKDNKIVPVSDYGYDILPLPPANDLGWNIVANPYMDIYESDIANSIKVGNLVREPGEPWNGKWIVDPESETKNLRYIVVRSYENDPDIIAAGHYKSILLSDGYKLEPFSSFFMQAPEGVSALIFDKDNTINRVAARRSNVDDRETFLRVNVGNRQTGCFISNKFTDEYEVGDDLESLYPIYQLINGYKLLYSAINDSIINSGVKVYTPSGNLHLDSKTNLNEFDEIYALYNDTWYDLLHGETVDVSGEFILQARRKAHNDTPTDIEETVTENTFNKILYNGNVYILKNNCIFNVLGERVR